MAMRFIILFFCLIGLVACAAPNQDGSTPKKRKGMYLSLRDTAVTAKFMASSRLAQLLIFQELPTDVWR